MRIFASLSSHHDPLTVTYWYKTRFQQRHNRQMSPHITTISIFSPISDSLPVSIKCSSSLLPPGPSHSKFPITSLSQSYCLLFFPSASQNRDRRDHSWMRYAIVTGLQMGWFAWSSCKNTFFFFLNWSHLSLRVRCTWSFPARGTTQWEGIDKHTL